LSTLLELFVYPIISI